MSGNTKDELGSCNNPNALVGKTMGANDQSLLQLE